MVGFGVLLADCEFSNSLFDFKATKQIICPLSFYMLVAHWLACIWYVIGRTDGKFWFAFEAFMMIENLIQKTPSN